MRYLLWATLLAPLGSAGCQGDIACIQWSEQQGACPSREDALDYLLPRCEDPIDSVDSEGELDGQECCYEVTKGEGDTCDAAE